MQRASRKTEQLPRMSSQDINLVAGEDAVLLLHGLAASPLELRYVARRLYRDGFSVHVPHLHSYGFGAAATDSREWHDRACAIFERMRREYRSVSVGGLCIGAVLALSVAAEKGRDVAALSLMSTTLSYDGWSLPWYRFLLPVGYYTPLRHIYAYREREPYGLKNETLRKRIARASRQAAVTEVGASSLPMNHIYHAMRLISHVKRSLPRVTAPALVVHAIDDDTASIRSADYVTSHIGSQIVRKIYLNDSYHMVTMDNERELVARETSDFLRGQVGGAVGALAQPGRRRARA